MIKSFQDVMDHARTRGPKVISVACAHDKEVLLAVDAAKKEGIAESILVGDEEKIHKIGLDLDINTKQFQIIDCPDMEAASLKAVELVSQGKAHMVMKGLVDTSIILKAVLNPEVGLKTGNVLSHVAVFQVSGYDRLFLISDAAMNINPDLNTKKQIILNSVKVAQALDIQIPKVGVICAKEKVDLKMPDTVDAKALEEMNHKGQLPGCVVGGPFGLDNAISMDSAIHKAIDHPVAGKADILLMPNIEAGNILYKSMVFFARAKNAGIVVGAKAPIILTSRADSEEAKLYSIALGVLCSSSLF